jgi:hypothetical protein
VRIARLTLALALAAALVGACGDDGGGHPDVDGSIDSPIDADIDAPPPATFTSYVIDLVQNQTADNTDPKPYSEFSGLNDPDQDNPAAYAVLFN